MDCDEVNLTVVYFIQTYKLICFRCGFVHFVVLIQTSRKSEQISKCFKTLKFPFPLGVDSVLQNKNWKISSKLLTQKELTQFSNLSDGNKEKEIYQPGVMCFFIKERWKQRKFDFSLISKKAIWIIIYLYDRYSSN